MQTTLKKEKERETMRRPATTIDDDFLTYILYIIYMFGLLYILILFSEFLCIVSYSVFSFEED